MTGLQLNFTPLKEPLGFIKVLQWIFSIFAFATCGGYSGQTTVQLECSNTSSKINVTASFKYPFRLNDQTFGPSAFCVQEWTPWHLRGDYSSSSQFFVCVAVFAFLYCIGALVMYIGYMHMYRESRKLPMIDFIITIIFAFLWLVSASAWAKGLSDVKQSVDPSFYGTTDECKTFFTCTPGDVTSMGSLNVSVVFGFLNLILWGGNAWFAYKETNLHTPPPGESPDQGPSPPEMAK
ncbi:synaptophysin-like protein 1 [Microcaecilia unicolor]|uniref:Synaptophysin-like protein 1 n=1 Tax=Microcaecilia unicolor TaxID=1415580 RepID=A0A6P7Z7V8_9AMPH|nr:synaptophysin-like protein 1 [Microcaecilia unicolor]